ncbi:bifunctional 3'-5' exonuclease/DNA polymerase [Actinocrinis puniceicyclus]|uniref:bifunctional 3'-5' exonuclease/DNA polymerase n=1 Tax=Actinocrinis puniceicyclus TaxID=977794 RepID=UPI0028A91F95|nr:bifunctional 3'-5' exonuclease/DNA polymerase [Actinocrinis puniceicyclus]
MRIAVTIDAAEPGGTGLSGWLQVLADDGAPTGPPRRAADLAAAVAEHECADPRPRWVWAATDSDYPRLLCAGVRVERCHDTALTEALLLGRAGRFGEPRSLEAAWARLHGLPVPEDPKPAARQEQGALFGAAAAEIAGVDAATSAQRRLELLTEVHARQLRRIAGTAPAGFATLVAAESAGALAAAEIAAGGLPWRVDAHDAVLTQLLGPRPFGDAPPAKLAELATRIGSALGHPHGRGFNPDSPAQVLRALRHAGFPVQSTRAWELRRVEHPAAALLLEYKELSRLHAAHGWAWQDAWVKGGRFRPEYVVGGVVSGRWATRNSGALQIPRIMRRAVIADEGWSLIVADAGQLEPRVLAAVSRDLGLARAAAEGDLYAALAAEAFDGDRAAAKRALLGAMYGQTSGGIGSLLTVLRKRFPVAMAYVEDAARTGERGGVVHSRLGRACPPPSSGWRSVVSGLPADEDGAAAGQAAQAGGAEPDLDADAGSEPGEHDPARRSGQAARSRGRFTRNFVIQASAADWALVWLAVLRRRLSGIAGGADRAQSGAAGLFAAAPHLVFFVHDEVVVHTPAALAQESAAAVAQAAEEARRIVFGPTPVRFPLATAIVDCYADAK